MINRSLSTLILCGLACTLVGVVRAEEKPNSKETTNSQDVEFFENKIRPVLVKHCYKCHSDQSKNLQGGLRVDLRESLRKGGESGPAVVPGDMKKSLLLDAVRHDTLEMPPDRKLPAAVIADFEHWIRDGAPDPRDGSADQPAKPTIDFAAAKEFWSFQPPQRRDPPAVNNAAWIKQPLDAFVLRRLEQEGVSPTPPADRRTWIRRATFDLTGLPPSPEEVEAFLADSSPEALERVVDRLLASPRYGERWARAWL
ncbi:MAG: DUF1549 domain-containing protein, partial [Planctomycetales bacterium]